MTAKSTLDIVATADKHDFIKGTPWEKRGKLIPKGATPQEALEIAGLDWKVTKAKSILIYDEPVCDGNGSPTYTKDEDGEDVLVTKEIRIDNPGISTFVVEQLSPATYYFAATAFNASGIESSFSGQVEMAVQ